MKKSKDNKRSNKNLVVWLLALAVLVATVVPVVPTDVKAAVISVNGAESLDVTNYGVTLKVNGSEYILAKQLTAKDAIYDTNGNIYLHLFDDMLSVCNFSVQGSSIKPVKVEKIQKWITTGEGTAQRLTGYIAADGTQKSALTVEQVKTLLGMTNNSNTNNTSNNSNNTSNSSNASNNSNNSNNSNTSTNNTSSNNSNSSNTSNNTSNTNTTNYLVVENGKVLLKVNGSTTTLKENVAVDKMLTDSEGTIWIKYLDGTLDCFNYEVQKDNPKLLTVVTGKVTALVESNGLAVGYYEQGKNGMQKLWTKEKIKEKTTTTKKYVEYDHMTPKGNTMIIKDSNDDEVDRYYLNRSTGVFKYHGVVRKGVKYAQINKNGNPVLIYKRGRVICINKNTFKTTNIEKKNGKFFNYATKGFPFATHVVRKSGTRYSVAKY